MFHYKNITSKGSAATVADAAKATAPAAGKPVRRRRGRNRGFWTIVALLVVASGGWFAWHQYFAPRSAAAPDTVAVARSDIQQTVLSNGILQANTLVSVGAQISGVIDKLDVNVGDTVKTGDLIAEIDPRDQQNAVKTAQAQLAIAKAQLESQQATVTQAQASLDRMNALVAKGVETKADQETAQAGVDTAKAQIDVINAQIQQAQLNVDTVNLNLSRTKITAPSDGTIVAVLVDQGQTVNANQTTPTIVKLADVSTMEIKAQISEADVPRVKPGQPVYFTILGEPDNKINAKLLSVSPAPDSVATDSDTTTPSTTTAIYYNGVFQVPNPDGKLRIDMTANVTIVLDEAKDALTVPSSALTKTPRGGYMVAVYDPATGRVRPTRVEVGINNNVSAEIKSGLNEGDQVVATGFTRRGFAGSGNGGANGSGQTASGQNGQAQNQNGQGRNGQQRGGNRGLGRFGGGPAGGILGF